jgi:phage terminase large subunit-like protein
MPIADPVAALLLLSGVRWDDKDLAGYILREEPDLWEKYIKPAYWDEDGKRVFLWPDLMNQAYLDERKKTLGAYEFSTNYLLDPIDQEKSPFKREYFADTKWKRPTERGEVLKFLEGKLVITTVDPAVSEESDACYAAVITCAWDSNGKCWIVDLFRDQGVQPSQLMNVIFEHYFQYRPTYVGMEAEGLQRVFRAYADQTSKERGVYPPWIDLKSGGRSKDHRIKGLEPYAQAHKIMIPEDFVEIEDELLRFPRGRHRDAIDALAYQLDLVFVVRQKAHEDTSSEWGAPKNPEAMLKQFRQKFGIELPSEPQNPMESFYAERWS